MWKPSKPSLIIKKLNKNQKENRRIFTNNFVEFLIEADTATKEISMNINNSLTANKMECHGLMLTNVLG